jgi:hypothetical protein
MRHGLVFAGTCIACVAVASLDAPAGPRCDHVLEATVPADTKMDQAVAFETGRSTLRPFDRIEITEVKGTSSHFAVGEDYVVRGEYTLESVDEADLSFTVTAIRRGEGCTTDNPRGRIKIKRGSGKFELVGPILYQGYPHVWFGRGVGGSDTEGVYFGKEDFLLRK